MSLEDYKLTSYEDNVKDLPDVVLNRAEELKALFDGRTDKEVKELHNALIDALAGGEGAAQLGAAIIAGLDLPPGVEPSVQEVMEALKRYTDQKVTDIGAGDMAQADYDPGGEVKAAGGIPDYTQDAAAQAVEDALKTVGEGYVAYSHVKEDATEPDTPNVHRLTGTVGATGIRFTATAAYEDGETFTLNGVAATALLQSGEAVAGGLFAAGVEVSCLVGGTAEAPTLNFKGGGASAANYDVVGGTTQPEGKENRIWVNTDVVIPHYGLFDAVMDANMPCPWDEWAEGDVAITAQGPTHSFVAYKGNKGSVFTPRSVWQWSGSTWVSRYAEIFINGIWQQLTNGMLLMDGVQYLGWKVMRGPTSGKLPVAAWTEGGTRLRLTMTKDTNGNGGIVFDPIDLTPFTQLVVTQPARGTYDYDCTVGAWANEGFVNPLATTVGKLSSGSIVCDIADVNGYAHVGHTYGYGAAGYFDSWIEFSRWYLI